MKGLAAEYPQIRPEPSWPKRAYGVLDGDSQEAQPTHSFVTEGPIRLHGVEPRLDLCEPSL
jgi:hypothetical protein